MKSISFIITLIIHYLIIVNLKLFDNFSPACIICFSGIIIGLAIKFFFKNRNTNLSHAGWGILYGSLVSFISMVLFTCYMLYNYPK
ncbi:hypothetical protein ACHRV6_12450 [Flavobacterium sp. FlaQc-51]|uniref:hypothetical protein n=1 Tax=unclassified Flavobacterium TaxID=196869 RepID=UPI000AEADF2A|nr:hypothetical protein [Flavobacterium sp. Leaf82]